MVESNYFGKGNTTSFTRAIYHPLTFAPQDDYHNYTVHWTSDQIDWIVDGQVVRTLPYAQADGGGGFYPQTPMKLSIGSWAAGDPANPKGVIEWAQGTTDFTQAPFDMFVKQVYVQDGSTGKTYTYSDKTGDWQSIKVEK
jgi:beta-glucanase (GH16 family)